MFSSCFECKERTLGCHSTCEKYIKEQKANEQKKKDQAEQRRLDTQLNALHTNRMQTERPGRKKVDYTIK